MKKRHILLLVTCVIIFAFACTEELEQSPIENQVTQVGKNPFSVPSMTRAMRVLENSSHYAAAGSPTLNPRVTHYYVVFSPQNNQELDLLAKSSDIDLFEEPLDISFLGEDKAMFEYNLAVLGADSPGHQFTTVSKDFKFPKVRYEIIAEIYLPFEDLSISSRNDTRGSAANIPSCDQYMLAQEWENQALLDGGYEEYIEVDICDDAYNGGNGDLGGSGGSPSNPYPANQWGRIMLYDNTPGVQRLIPVSGVRVTTTRFLSWKRSDTNAEGYYKVNSPHHEKKSQYHIKWEDDDFRIIAHDGGQAKLEGPDQTGPWNFDIANDTKAQWYGTAFSAAKQYFDGERYGLAKPYNGGLFRTTVKVRDNDCTSRYMPLADAPLLGAAFFNDIKVCVANSKLNTSRIYGTTIHELTHSANYKETPDAFINQLTIHLIGSGERGRRVMESWATGVEWWFTVNKYRVLSGNDNWGTFGTGFVINQNEQDVTIDNSRQADSGEAIRDDVYTSLVIDLMDNHDQRTATGDPSRPLDRVSGYTINQIEAALYRNYGVELFTNWKHNLLEMFNNPTQQFVHEYFNNWDQLN